MASFISLFLLCGGVFVSRSASVNASPMGAVIDVTRRVRDSTDALPDVLFTGATILAGVFVVAYVVRMFERT